MSKEVQQPAIQPPDLKDPFSWALVARVHSQWLSHVAPQLGMDIHKLVLGDVLSSIIGDDANVFTWTHGDFFNPEMNYPAASRRGIKTISTVLYEWEYNS